jgi:hypothetical protein
METEQNGMASSSASQPLDVTCHAVEIVVIDDEEMEQPVNRADIYGEGTEPLPELDPSPNDGPLWQWWDGDTVHWHWLDTSVQPNYTKLSWQAERVWTKVKEHEVRWNFRAAFGILKWEPSEPPEYAVIVKMALLDSDNTTKILMLLVEPGGNQRWDKFIIKTLRRCVYKADFRSRMVDTEFPIFNNVEQLRLVVRALIAWMRVHPLRLSDIRCGRWQDLRLKQLGPIEHRLTF